MGFLRALIDSAARFEQALPPTGFAVGTVAWALDLDILKPQNSQLVRIDADAAYVPDKPPDRTSTRVSAKLFTDKAEYVLGTAEPPEGKRGRSQNEPKERSPDQASRAHSAFVELTAHAEERFPEILKGTTGALRSLPDHLKSLPKSTDQVALRLSGKRLTDHPELTALWAEMLAQRTGGQVAACAICGVKKPLLRLFPGDISLFRERGVKLMSVDTEREETAGRDSEGALTSVGSAFSSRGHLQLQNSPICLQCASVALQVCRHLIEGHTESPLGLNYAVLSRGESALQNQLSVFWTKEAAPQRSGDGTGATTGSVLLAGPEAAARLLLGGQVIPENGPPPEDAQMRALLATPWSGGASTRLRTDAFYLAVLSPNKTRLVVRDWLELGVAAVHASVSRYVAAARITDPTGSYTCFPPIPALLDALGVGKTEKLAEGHRSNDPNLLRSLLRCAFRGSAPPLDLLARAVRRFAIPSTEKDEREALLKRFDLAAAMKLCVTHDRTLEEQEAMEQLNTRRRTPAYLCGCLLAILDEVQRQYHRPNKVNATLADRFYGTASTAPAAIFANLLNIATKAHLPKLRREGRDFITSSVEEACAAIDDAGGFPDPLDLRGQAEFGLGYYHQRARFAAKRREAKSNESQPVSDTEGEHNG